MTAFALLFLMMNLSTTSGLIDDNVSQKTYIKSYPSALSYQHSYFDMSFADGGSLVQADSDTTYFLAR